VPQITLRHQNLKFPEKVPLNVRECVCRVDNTAEMQVLQHVDLLQNFQPVEHA